MAFNLSAEAQATFYKKVFGPTHPVSVKVEALIVAGVKFETSLYTCKAVWQGSTFTQGLTKGSTSFIKGTINPLEAEQNKQAITKWIDKLMLVSGLVTAAPPAPAIPVVEDPSIDDLDPSFTDTPAEQFKVVLKSAAPHANLLFLIKAIRNWTESMLVVAKNQAEAVVKGEQVTLDKFGSLDQVEAQVQAFLKIGVHAEILDIHGKVVATPLAPVVEAPKAPKAVSKPTNAVVNLRDAAVLGQKVHGTSGGSVYHTVAVNPRVKVAARIYSAGSISIRAEWKNPLPTEMTSLKNSGLLMKSEYASIHLNANEVPPGRVIGAFVVGLGIDWDEAVFNASQLVVENK